MSSMLNIYESYGMNTAINLSKCMYLQQKGVNHKDVSTRRSYDVYCFYWYRALNYMCSLVTTVYSVINDILLQLSSSIATLYGKTHIYVKSIQN